MKNPQPKPLLTDTVYQYVSQNAVYSKTNSKHFDQI